MNEWLKKVTDTAKKMWSNWKPIQKVILFGIIVIVIVVIIASVKLSAKPSTVSPPGQILAFLQGRRLSGSTSSKNTPPVFLHLQSGMRKSQSLYFISSLISIFIYFLMPNYHPTDDNSYSNNGCTGHCSTAFQGIKFSLIL